MSKVMACDPGTMFFQVAENDSSGKLNIKEIRVYYLKIPLLQFLYYEFIIKFV